MNNDYYTRLAQLESSNNPLARNPKSSAKGKYQFIDSTAKQYGITAPFGTPEYARQEEDAIKRFTADNYNILKQKLGREPSQGELYLAHQQGATGAANLINSQGNASDIVGQDAIALNAGNQNQTGQDFANQWINKFEGGQGQDVMRGDSGSDYLGRTIQLPDGRSIALTGNETPEQLSALKEKLRTKYIQQPSKEPVRTELPQGDDAGAGKAFAYGIAGGQIPFGNRITSGIGAGIATAYDALGGKSDLGFQDYYKQALEDTKVTQEANPKATLAGNLLGVATTLPAAFSKVPQGTNLLAQTGKGANYAKELAAKVASYSPFQGAGKLARAGNIATRYAGRTALASPITGAYFAGEADTGEMADKFKQGAGMGAVLSAAVPASTVALGAALKGSKNIAKGITARAPEVLDEALAGMKNVGDSLYKQSEQSGAILTPSAAQGISSSINKIIKNPETKATQGLYKNTLSAIQDLQDDLTAGNTGLGTIDAHRQILGNIAKDITNPNRAQEAEAARRIIESLDDAIEQLTPESIQSKSTQAVDSLLKARKQWSQMKKFEKVAEIIKNSGGDANKLKRDIERFASKSKNTLGWSKDELKALDFAGKQTTGEGLLKMAGKFGFDLGSGRAVGNTALPILGGLGAGVGGAGLAPAMTIPAIGTAARQGQKYLARGKAEALLRALEQGAIKPNQTSITAQQLAKQLQRGSGVPMANILNQNVGVR